MFNGNRKFAHFSKIWKRKLDHQTLLDFAILAGKWQKKPFHMKSPVKNFYGRAKGGGHRTVLPP